MHCQSKPRTILKKAHYYPGRVHCQPKAQAHTTTPSRSEYIEEPLRPRCPSPILVLASFGKKGDGRLRRWPDGCCIVRLGRAQPSNLRASWFNVPSASSSSLPPPVLVLAFFLEKRRRTPRPGRMPAVGRMVAVSFSDGDRS